MGFLHTYCAPVRIWDAHVSYGSTVHKGNLYIYIYIYIYIYVKALLRVLYVKYKVRGMQYSNRWYVIDGNIYNAKLNAILPSRPKLVINKLNTNHYSHITA